jgi:hypothetical protein
MGASQASRGIFGPLRLAAFFRRSFSSSGVELGENLIVGDSFFAAPCAVGVTEQGRS